MELQRLEAEKRREYVRLRKRVRDFKTQKTIHGVREKWVGQKGEKYKHWDTET